MPVTRRNNDKIIRAVIAEDHVLIRDLIIQHLRTNSVRCRFLAQVTNVSAAVQACLDHRPHVLLLRVALLAQMGDTEMSSLRERVPNMKVVIYAGSWATDQRIGRAMKTGVDAFVGKACGIHEFVTAIQTVNRGEKYFCAQGKRLLAEMACGQHSKKGTSGGISPRELEILRLIANGDTSKQIARSLGLSLATVETHRRNMMAKTDSHNAADLIRYGHRCGLLHEAN